MWSKFFLNIIMWSNYVHLLYSMLFNIKHNDYLFILTQATDEGAQ